MKAKDLRCPQEETRYGVALAFSILAWIVLVVTIVGLLYAAFIVPAVLIGHALFIAYIRGNGVKIGPEQMPELWRRVENAAEKLGLETVPDTYVLQSGGALNAFATKLFARKFIILYSDLVEACEAENPSLDTPDSPPSELDFVIGHELGHIALGHLTWLLLPARIIPLLGPAYSRACEYSCDACGDAVTDNPEVSMRSLAILSGGGRVGRRLNLSAFADQRKAAGKFWSAVYELNASHPFLCKRVAVLSERHQPGSAAAHGRNKLSYPLAPFFGAFTGGAAGASMMVIVVVAVMAAAMIPAYQRARAMQARLADPYADDAFLGTAPEDVPSSFSAEDGYLSGENYPWRMKIPNPSWQVLPMNLARVNNPLSDGWMTLPDSDAHIFVVAEPVGNSHPLSELETIVLDTAKNAGENYQLIDKTPMSVSDGEGVMLHWKSRIDGDDMEFLTALHLSHGYLFQIVNFASSEKFTQVRPHFIAAVESFQMLNQPESPSQL